MCRAAGKTPPQAASAANGAKRQKAPREVCLPDEVLSLVRPRSGGSLARAAKSLIVRDKEARAACAVVVGEADGGGAGGTVYEEVCGEAFEEGYGFESFCIVC